MTRPDLDADAAVKALSFRLRDWGVDDPGSKARSFIDDLTSRGWTVTKDFPFRRPPKLHEECPTHPGNYSVGCAGHEADRKARRDEATERERLSIEQAKVRAREAVMASRHTTQEAAHG